ncbi:MAG: ketopantoate reductase family protein [Candidatus Limnocylindrales bacterium]
MHLVVLGAGALGSLFGASAWLGSGIKTTLVARGEHARAMQERGIVLRGRDGREQVARGPGLEVVTEPALIEGCVDFLVVTVKDRDLEGALEQSGPIADRVATVLSLQNGIGRDDNLGAVFGRGAVIGAMTMEGAAISAPGVVERLLTSTTYVGELDGTATARVASLVEILCRGGLQTEAVDDIETARWTKFVQSCAASGVCGVTRLGYAPSTATDAGANLYVELIIEGVAVMRACGLEPGRVFTGSARVRDVASLPREAAVALVRDLATRLVAEGYVGTTSLARDLALGHPTEADALMGAMCRIADSRGLSVPTMRATYWAIKATEASGTGAGR